MPYSLSYSYDGVGNRMLMSDGEGRRTTYTYLSTPYTNAIVDIQPPYEAAKTRVSWYELYKSTIRFLNNGTASTEYQVTGPNGWELARTHFGPVVHRDPTKRFTMRRATVCRWANLTPVARRR